jgi:putative RNA 2'-phosphotransferase
VTRRCTDTHFYVEGRYTASGTLTYQNDKGVVLTVVCGRRDSRPGQVHIKDLVAGELLYDPAGNPLVFDPERSLGRKGRRGADPNTTNDDSTTKKKPSRATVARDSRALSWLLRRGAIESGLSMNKAGWASTAAVMATLGMHQDSLDAAVAYNNKSRLAIRAGARGSTEIRASQGHSIKGTPVESSALEASWEKVYPTQSLWHTTTREALPSVLTSGLLPRDRTHVHLARSATSTVGKRAAAGPLIEIDPVVLAAMGIDVFAAPNGVLLARRVPPEALRYTATQDGTPTTSTLSPTTTDTTTTSPSATLSMD